MKRIITFIFFLCFSFFMSVGYGQARSSSYDSIVNARLRTNVSKYFQDQHRLFSSELKGLDKEYVVYITFKYVGNNRVTLLPSVSEDSMLDYRVGNYVSWLIYRSGDIWGEKGLGYGPLQKGDEFGYKFIFTPESMPDSLSFINKQVFEYYWSSNENCISAPPINNTEKRWAYLAGKSVRYSNLGMGLGNRYQVIHLKY